MGGGGGGEGGNSGNVNLFEFLLILSFMGRREGVSSSRESQ